jgi:hypothetical protein
VEFGPETDEVTKWIIFRNIGTCRGDFRQGVDGIFNLLTTYTRDSEMQVITALSLISTIHSSP